MIAGFLSFMLGGAVAMGIQIVCGLPVVLFASGIVFHFFCGGIAAIFGNVTGGRRGALIGPFIIGFAMTWAPILTTTFLGAQFPEYATTFFSDADFNVVSIILGALAQMGPVLIYVLTAVVILFPFVQPRFRKRSLLIPQFLRERQRLVLSVVSVAILPRFHLQRARKNR